MPSRHQKLFALLQIPGDVAALITLISVAFGLMAVATVWGIASVSGLPVGPQILFLVAFGVLAITLIGAILVALYRLWNRRKRKADDRIIAIAQGEVRQILMALLEEMETKLPELGSELAKELETASAPYFDALGAFIKAIVEHTHNDRGEAEYPRMKEVSDLLRSAIGENDSRRNED